MMSMQFHPINFKLFVFLSKLLGPRLFVYYAVFLLEKKKTIFIIEE